MNIFTVPSLVGLLIEAIGALLISGLCVVLMRTAPRDPLFYWAIGWVMLCFSLATLLMCFQLPAVAPFGQPMYLLGEYVFGYMVFAGCREYATGRRLRPVEGWLLVPAAVLAVGLPRLGHVDFNTFFAFHAVVYGSLFLMAFVALNRARPHAREVAGLRVTKLALVLLTAAYFHYAPLFWMASHGLVPNPLPYLEYSPFFDLIFLFMLMFGMVMIVTGETQYELEMANVELARARDRLETMAQLDHLTSALNRHALYSLIEDPRPGRRTVFSGSAVVADVDNLKAINDRHGHLVGDAAIRAVASAIRACIRADDLLFRWGGDEFLVLLIGVNETDARARLAGVNDSLRRARMPECPDPVDVSVTMGFAPFDSAKALSQVIALADEAMFKRKRKGWPRGG